MKPKKRQKLCHHCDAEVDLDVIVCPFCAADLREEKPEQQRSSAASTVKQLHTGEPQPLYPPAPTYSIRGLPEEAPAQEMAISAPEEEIQKTPLTAIVLFTLGAQLLILALMMLFFGDGGMLLLKWNAKWWPLYLVGAAPLLFFGVRSLR